MWWKDGDEKDEEVDEWCSIAQFHGVEFATGEGEVQWFDLLKLIQNQEEATYVDKISRLSVGR